MLLPKNWLESDLQEIATLAPFQEIHTPLLSDKSVRLLVKREDLLHPLIGGNKVYKLHGILNAYLSAGGKLPIATFGGAYSNHVHALAALGKMLDVETVAVIRGEQAESLSPTLVDAQKWGMGLHFVSRTDYRLRGDTAYVDKLDELLGPCYWVPEGGSALMGARGGVSLAKGLLSACPEPVDYLFHACGTGSTLAGLIAGAANTPQTQVVGINVLKGAVGLSQEVDRQVDALGMAADNWMVLNHYHGGGYGKFSSDLAEFVSCFEQDNGFLLDPVYTSKVLMGIFDLVEKNFFTKGSLVVAIHSGGLQGRRGFGLEWKSECGEI